MPKTLGVPKELLELCEAIAKEWNELDRSTYRYAKRPKGYRLPWGRVNWAHALRWLAQRGAVGVKKPKKPAKKKAKKKAPPRVTKMRKKSAKKRPQKKKATKKARRARK